MAFKALQHVVQIVQLKYIYYPMLYPRWRQELCSSIGPHVSLQPRAEAGEQAG